jgi:adenosine kinase
VVDPTGAGDAYRGGFVAGMLRGADLATCGRMGSVAAVYAVESYGTQSHGYTPDAFWQRYAESFG